MKDLIAYCGLDCEKCDARRATLTDDNALREKTAKLWSVNGTAATLSEVIAPTAIIAAKTAVMIILKILFSLFIIQTPCAYFSFHSSFFSEISQKNTGKASPFSPPGEIRKSARLPLYI